MELRTVDNYEIRGELGHGGMAVVYRAHDTRLHRDVALKVLHEHIAGRAENRQRFEREARAVAKLKHPNIISVYGFSSPSAPVGYIAAELIEGPTLREFVEDTGFAHPDVAAMVGLELAEALEHAHSLGVIHRDIKPENVMIDPDGVPKLMDFGLARLLDATKVTQTGALMGSPAHMSPETIEGRPIDQRADIFAFGTVLYFLTTRKLPFDGSNPAVVLNAILSGRFAEPQLLNPRIGSQLARIIKTCMAQEPDDRYASTHELVEALQDYLATMGVTRPGEELRAFFRDPTGYNESFAERLESALVSLAEGYIAARKVAAAVDCCDRLLAIRPDHPIALSLIKSVRRRRRTREALAVMGIVMLLALAVVLLLTQSNRGAGTPDELAGQPEAEAAGQANAAAVAERASSMAGELPIAAAVRRTHHALDQAMTSVDDSVDANMERAFAEARSPLDGALATANQSSREAAIRRQLERLRNSPPRRADGSGLEPVVFGSGTDAGGGATDVAEPDPVFGITLRVLPPAAIVSIDGRRYSHEQIRRGLELTAGPHVVVATHPQTDASISREIEVRPGQRNEWEFEVPWPPASLVVESVREGSVFVDGTRLGGTNERLEVAIEGMLPSRTIAVRVVPDGDFGMAWERGSVTLTQGNLTTLFAEF